MGIQGFGGRVSAEAQSRVVVAVRAGDPRVVAALSGTDEVIVVPWGDRGDAEVVVVRAEMVTDVVVDELVALAGEVGAGARRVVLVAGPLRERHLPRLLGAGVVSILSCRDVSARQLVRAVIASHGGRAVVPDVVVRWLVDEVRSAQSNLLVTRGLASGGLSVREVEVLRRLAEGLDTGRIAAELNYSERTIKKIIQDVMSRLKLRNRAHAVSYAMRVGAI